MIKKNRGNLLENEDDSPEGLRGGTWEELEGESYVILFQLKSLKNYFIKKLKLKKKKDELGP